MKRAAFLTVLLFAGASVSAQQPPPQPKPAPEAQATNGQTDTPTHAAQPAAAPKLGHPLDPHDVDVLTGKADRDAQVPRATPYVSLSGCGYSAFGGCTAGTRRFSPFVFGSVHGRPFFFNSGIFHNSGFRGPRGRFVP